jgi:uncharacterized protein (TIGR03118 family)
MSTDPAPASRRRRARTRALLVSALAAVVSLALVGTVAPAGAAGHRHGTRTTHHARHSHQVRHHVRHEARDRVRHEARREGAFTQTNLVSDLPGTAALTDPAVRNPWGIAFGPTTPLWVDNQFSPDPSVPSKITLYRGANGVDPITKVPLEVAATSPTGIVFNPTTSFVIDQGGARVPARFIMAEIGGATAPEGRITGWSNVPSPAATTTPTAAVKTPSLPFGLALLPAGEDRGDELLVADGLTGTIDVYDASFHPVTGSRFVDPMAAAQGLEPYNVAVLDGRV